MREQRADRQQVFFASGLGCPAAPTRLARRCNLSPVARLRAVWSKRLMASGMIGVVEILPLFSTSRAPESRSTVRLGVNRPAGPGLPLRRRQKKLPAWLATRTRQSGAALAGGFGHILMRGGNRLAQRSS